MTLPPTRSRTPAPPRAARARSGRRGSCPATHTRDSGRASLDCDSMPHPEVEQEQAYVDHAYECLEKMRKTLEGTQDTMATEFAALAIEAWMKRRQKTFVDAERGLCFGRLRLDGPQPPPERGPPSVPRRER